MFETPTRAGGMRETLSSLRFHHVLAMLLFVIALTLPVLVGATTDLGPYGSSGGNAFRAECPRGSYLVGLQGKAGDWVDRIEMLCASWMHSGQIFGPSSVVGSFGDSRGGRTTFGNCNDGSVKNRAIHSWSVTVLRSDKPFVNKLGVQCVALGPPGPPGTFVFGSSSAPSNRPFNEPFGLSNPDQVCPVGEAAVGIHGRAGLFLDAVGLICGPFPPKRTLPFDTQVNPLTKTPAQSSPSSVAPPPSQGNSAAAPMLRPPTTQSQGSGAFSGMVRPRGIGEETGSDSNKTQQPMTEIEKKP